MIKTRINNEYKDIIKIFGGGTLQKEIIKVWSREAQEYVYESSVEYTGSPPITIRANGDVLLDYRIYGNTIQSGTPTPENPIIPNGCGEKTENLFDKSTVTPNSYISDSTGILQYSSGTERNSSDYIDVGGMTNIYIATFTTTATATWGAFYDNNKNYISGITRYNASIPVPNNAKYLRITVHNYYLDTLMLTEGSTAPADYIPYGYKLPMTVGDGNTTQTIPVYIGENQLDVGEYVSYGEQKIYRDVDGTLTPTDPPVSPPEIPTIGGTTVIDYDGTPKPSQMYVKYRR